MGWYFSRIDASPSFVAFVFIWHALNMALDLVDFDDRWQTAWVASFIIEVLGIEWFSMHHLMIAVIELKILFYHFLFNNIY